VQQVRAVRIPQAIPLVAVALFLRLGAPSDPAWAGSATATLGVSATVVANCTIATAAIAFGNHNPVGAHASTPLDASGSVTITCTQGTTATVGFDTGTNAGGASGSGLLAPGIALNNAPRTFSVYGRIPAAQNKPVGNYINTVVATVNF
jgi:spore coat protein U domain-containing protein, fimbrial subunit CupE1/2/3/6